MKIQSQWLQAMPKFSSCTLESLSMGVCRIVSVSSTRKITLTISLVILVCVSVLTTMQESLWLDNRSKFQLRARFSSIEQSTDQNIIQRDSPTYINLCRMYAMSYQVQNSVSESSRYLHTHQETTQDVEATVIEEVDKICVDTSTPHTSTMTILASSWIDQIASKYLKNWNFRYEHNCNDRHIETQSEKLGLQQFLPSSLIMDDMQDMEETAQALNHVCRACISYEDDQAPHDPSCVLFGYDRLKPNAVHHHVREWPVLEFIQKNMDVAVYNHNSENAEPEDYDENTVTIFLPCPAEDCHIGSSFYSSDDTHESQNTMPIYSIVQNIPRHVKFISIVNLLPNVPDINDCNDKNLRPCAIQSHVSNLKRLRVNLRNILSEFFPTAMIARYEESGSAIALSDRVIRSRGTVICPVASVSCVIPALIRQQNRQRTIMLHSPSLYPYMPSLIDTDNPSIHFLSSPDEILRVDCPTLRGRFGHWLQNLELAPYLQYQMKDMYVAGEVSVMYKPTPEKPFPEHTTYAFNDVDHTMDNILQFPIRNEGICPFSTINAGIVCHAMKASNVNRIMMVGDSLTGHQALSFWFQLGNTRLPNLYMRSIERYYHAWKDNLVCDDQQTIELVFIRNDRMIEPENAEEFEVNCGGEFCYVWTEEYKKFEGKTLFITNFGSHFNVGKRGITLPQASRNFADFWKSDYEERINAGKEPNIGFFRTTATGHPNCENKLAPYNNYQKYLQSLEDASKEWKRKFFEIYRWDLFPHQNRQIMQDLANIPNMHIVDVFYMSALRPDGHCSSQVNVLNHGSDCLHYLLPGPVDWWNYLWFTNFMEIENITL